MVDDGVDGNHPELSENYVMFVFNFVFFFVIYITQSFKTALTVYSSLTIDSNFGLKWTCIFQNSTASFDFIENDEVPKPKHRTVSGYVQKCCW